MVGRDVVIDVDPLRDVRLQLPPCLPALVEAMRGLKSKCSVRSASCTDFITRLQCSHLSRVEEVGRAHAKHIEHQVIGTLIEISADDAQALLPQAPPPHERGASAQSQPTTTSLLHPSSGLSSGAAQA